MSPSEVPQEVRIATDCSAALDRGEKDVAKLLAERGLKLATGTGNAKWIRRFEHLLRLSTGAAIKGAAYVPPTCSFCLESGPRNVVAGPKAYICDNCVALCSAQQLSGSPIELLVADDVACSFCGRLRSTRPLFRANGFCICGECVQTCVEMAE
jgi:hypothetical protein